MTREEMIQYLNRFNIASFAELRTWDDNRLFASVEFVKIQLEKKA